MSKREQQSNKGKDLALTQFLEWREKFYPHSSFSECWKLIMHLREQNSNISWVYHVAYNALHNKMKELGISKRANSEEQDVGTIDEMHETLQSNYEEIKDSASAEEVDADVLQANTFLQRKVQKLQDITRIERKGWREDSRMYNALENFNTALVSELAHIDMNNVTRVHDTKIEGAVGVVCLSDLHFNELVALPHNRYDFEVAGKRLKLLASRARALFKANEVSRVVVAMCGDLLNSDRRLDELLNMSTNRAKACILATSILQQFIVDLNLDFDISVVSVSGNESRINKDWGWSTIMASDNFDFTIYNILRYVFKDAKGVEFLVGDAVEQVININGSNVLITHGMQIATDIEKSVQQLKGKYSSQKINIDYCLFGHIHSARVGDTYARNSSLVGANDYSDRGLNLDSRASQNAFVFHKDGNRDGYKIDLQNADRIEGYSIVKELEAYHAKSADKLKSGHTILKIIV